MMLPPPTLAHNLVVLQKFVAFYKHWHAHLTKLPRVTRFTIGVKIDARATECIEMLLRAGFAPRGEKPALLKGASVTLDTVKFFLQLPWEMKILDHATYTAMALELQEIGKMVGKWMQQLDRA